MRPLALAVPLATCWLAAGALAGCRHPAFGPDSDARLEAAVTDSTSSAASDDAIAREIQKRSCSGERSKLRNAEKDERGESDRLAEYTKLYKELTKRGRELDRIIKENPGAEFANEGKTASQVLDECTALAADTRSSFDTFLRELVELPIMKEFHGVREVAVARVDFDSLREGIEALSPDDRESLLARIEGAEEKVGKKKSGKGHK